MSVVWDMPIGAYHRAEHVTHSKMRDYASKGARYYAMRHVTRTTPQTENSEAQVFGQVLEDIVQGRGFDSSAYAVKPDGMTFQTREGKAWRAAQAEAGKRILTADELASMDEMHTSLQENETAIEMIRCCRKQPTFSAGYPGVPGIGARPDWASENGCALTGFEAFSLDLKSTIGLAKLTSGRGILEWGYHSQAALVRHAMRQTWPGNTWHFLIAVEKQRPYRCQVIEITPQWLDIGWQWCERNLTKLARHYESDSWPRVDSELVSLPAPPPWAADSIDDDEQAA